MTERHGLNVPQADAIWDAIAIPGPRQPTFMEQYDRTCKTVAELLAERPMQTAQGRCPACNWQSLFLGDGGHVTCSRLECPDPTAADNLLHGDHGNAAKFADLEQQLAALRQVARGYCPACGRGDAAPTVTEWEQQKQRAERLEITNRALNTAALEALERAEHAETTLAETIASLERAIHRARRAETALTQARQLHQQICLLAQSAVSRAFVCAMCDALAGGHPAPAATQATDRQEQP